MTAMSLLPFICVKLCHKKKTLEGKNKRNKNKICGRKLASSNFSNYEASNLEKIMGKLEERSWWSQANV